MKQLDTVAKRQRRNTVAKRQLSITRYLRPAKPDPSREFIGIETTGQRPVLERCESQWKLWLAYDQRLENGTVLVMHDNGLVERFVLRVNDKDEHDIIRRRDK